MLHEVAQKHHAVLAVIDFRMELYAPGLLAADVEGSLAHIGRRGHTLQLGGHRGDGVAVAHPHHRALTHAFHKWVGGIYEGEVCFAVFAGLGAFHRAAEALGKVLRTVADAKQREAAAQSLQIHLRRLWRVDREGRAAEYHSYNVGSVGRELVIGMNFAVCVQFAHASGYELRVLRTEVQYDYFLHRQWGLGDGL